MGIATGFTKERMLRIENESIVDGEVASNGHLILSTREGTLIDAGFIRGDVSVVNTENTDSVSMSVRGVGTPLDPWILSAEMKGLAANTVVKGLLEANYRGGKARVKVNGVLSNESYPWLTPYNPQGSREVNLLKMGSSWIITGQNMDAYLPIEYNQQLFAMHLERAASAAYTNRPRMVKLPSGLIVLTGLIAMKGSVPDGTTIFTLPPGYRPDNDMLMPIEQNETSRSIRINQSGAVSIYGNYQTDGWISLDGIAFWSAGIAQWTEFGTGGSTWGSSFERNPGWDNFGIPGYWKDPYGFVWFRGLVRTKVAVSADNTPILDLPATHRPFRQTHNRITSNNSYGLVGSNPNNGLNWKTGNNGTAGVWLSLASVVIDTTDAQANPWIDVQSMGGTWSAYGAQFTQPGYLLREDGLRIARGLYGNGSWPVNLFYLRDAEFWPAHGRIILARTGGNVRARLDISGYTDSTAERGSFLISQGSSWFSADGTIWIP